MKKVFKNKTSFIFKYCIKVLYLHQNLIKKKKIMPLTSIFSSNQRDKSEAVFASLLKLSQVDGVVSADEQDVLDRMAKRLEILDARRKEQSLKILLLFLLWLMKNALRIYTI